MGFGGVTPWSRRMVVEDRKWLDDLEYAGLLGIAQVLPGPNTPNMCVIIGQRFAGLPGAIASVVGLMAVPLLALVVIAVGYDALASAGQQRPLPVWSSARRSRWGRARGSI